MSEGKGYRVEQVDANRRMVAASASVNRLGDTIHLVTEADIGEARQAIAAHRARTGERLSLTAYVVVCLAQALHENPRFNSFLKGGRLFVLDDLTISVLVERDLEGGKVPEPVAIHAADTKSYRQVNDELRAAQQRASQRLGSLGGMEWIRFIPAFLLRTFVRLASRNVGMQKRYGVIGVTAVGMFGRGPVWLLPLTRATVTVAVGGIARHPVVVDGHLQEHEFLCLTVSFNHDIIDGAPAARFTGRLAELLSGGSELRQLTGVSGTAATVRSPG